jgi:hypothetical protein
MGWFTACGEFVGSAVSSYMRTSAKLKKLDVESEDFCPEATKKFVSKSLENCYPASEDLTWWGRRITEYNLGKNDYFGSLLAIDGNTKLTKRAMCILALKTAAKCICAGYNEDEIRAVTYSYLALRQLD